MVKCAKCAKTVTKKTPGLQCGKCSKWLHASCIPMTTEQLNALCGTEAVEWKCKTCLYQSKHKRISAILPEAEDEENTDTEQVIIMKDNFSEDFLRELRSDIRSAIKEEIQRTLKFYSDKIDDFQMKVDHCEEKIKILSNQNKDLQNKYDNMQLKYSVLEQKINSVEQSYMENKIEICGVPKTENENLKDITHKIAHKIQTNADEVISVYRKERRAPAAQQRVASTLVVTLQAGRRDGWLAAARAATVTGLDVGHDDGSRIFLREALAPATAFLLWKAKTELRKNDLYKYVWCKGGNVLVKKNDQAKVQTVRSEQDIERLLKVG